MGSADRSDTTSNRGKVILCADDYAMTEGISAGIEELISEQRLSATSAIVTGHHWSTHARRIETYRPNAAVGLHLNLSLGSPIGSMPNLAPLGQLPALGDLVKRALTGRLDEAEITAEINRQLDCFEDVFGHPPDMLDGHQHVHVLPHIRGPLLRVLAERYPKAKPLLRDPADAWTSIIARGRVVPKALALSFLAFGFGARARSLGFLTNHGFSGVSSFNDTIPYARELESAFVKTGPFHLIMCHPGYPDEELARIDPVVGRRLSELKALQDDPDLPFRIIRPQRGADGFISWDFADD